MNVPSNLTLALTLILGAASAPAQLTPDVGRSPLWQPQDGRTPIESLPGSDDALHVVTEPGSYVLTRNLDGESGKSGIDVQASGVTIDLQGFVMRGTSGALDGIRLAAFARDLVVRNGTIRGWTSGVAQVFLIGGGLVPRTSRFERLRLIGNGLYGLETGTGSRVERCLAAENDYGLVVSGSQVEACVVSNNTTKGIQLAGAGSIRRCVVRSTGTGSQDGVQLLDGGGVLEKSVVTSGVIRVESIGTDRIASVRTNLAAGSTWGILADSRCRIVDNLSAGHVSTGILVTGDGCHVEGNLVTQCGSNALNVTGASVATANASRDNASGDNWNFSGGALAGSFLPFGELGELSAFGHPLF